MFLMQQYITLPAASFSTYCCIKNIKRTSQRIPQRGELPDAYPAHQRRENRSVNTRHSQVIAANPKAARVMAGPVLYPLAKLNHGVASLAHVKAKDR